MRFYVASQYQLLVVIAIGIVALAALTALVVTAFGRLGRMLEREPDSPDLVCRNCKAKTVRTSFQSGAVDFLFAAVACTPVRCQVCYYRFHVRRRPAAQGASAATTLE